VDVECVRLPQDTVTPTMTCVSTVCDVLYVVSRETSVGKHEPDQRADPYRSPNKVKKETAYTFGTK
jgi:hypothetical protein